MATSQTSLPRMLMGPAILRVVASACVAGGLGLAFWLVFHIASRSHFARTACGGGQFGCLGVALLGGLAAIVAIIVIAWPLLHAARVRPAWPVALLGPIVAVISDRAFMTLADRSFVTGLWMLLAISYAAAAIITAPRLYRYWSAVVAIGVAVLDLATKTLANR